MRAIVAVSALILTGVLAAPVAAKESLGVFGQWGAFKDADKPVCYAIAAAEDSRSTRDGSPYVSIATWPARQIRGQFHIRLSEQIADQATINLVVGARRFVLTGSGADAWAPGPREDAQILSAIRSASRMSVSASNMTGSRFTDRYSLDGAATAMDAASVGCGRRR